MGETAFTCVDEDVAGVSGAAGIITTCKDPQSRSQLAGLGFQT